MYMQSIRHVGIFMPLPTHWPSVLKPQLLAVLLPKHQLPSEPLAFGLCGSMVAWYFAIPESVYDSICSDLKFEDPDQVRLQNVTFCSTPLQACFVARLLLV